MKKNIFHEKVEYFPTLDDDFFLRYAKENERRFILQEIKASSIILAPIIVRGKVVGKIAFIMTSPKRQFTVTDMAVIEDLSARISLAFYNAKLYTEAQNAVTLRDEFISVASHELKTPLTSIKVYAQLLQRQKKFEENEYLPKINEQVEKLNRLIQDLLNISRIRSGKMTFIKEQFDLGKLVSEVVSTHKQSAKTHTIELKDVLHEKVLGDKDRIGQVIVNLLTNAIRYSPEKSTIVVEMRPANHAVEVAVKDQGIGIDKAQMRRIFDRFYQINAKKRKTSLGLGIGLYISREIIERHKGRIWVESKKGKGSTFTFSLPL